jgi:signal transduction histidine kinase/ActR/RegA family two-component response regulator/CHASE3 domain sensor protein
MRRGLDLTIRQRLALGFGAAGVLLVVLAVMSHQWTREVAAERERHLAVIAPRAEAADRLESAILYVGIAARNQALNPGPAHRRAYEAAVQQVRDQLRILSGLPKDPDGLVVFARIPPLAAEYERAADAAVDAATRSGTSLPALEDEMSGAREALLEVVREYAALQQHKVDEARARIGTAVDRMGRAALGLGAVVLGLLAITGLVTVRAVHGPALALVAAARRIARGDFDSAIGMAGDGSPRRDELAQLSASLGQMALELKSREDRLRAIARLASAMASSLDATALCEAALDVLRDHLGIEGGAVYLLGGGKELRRRSRRRIAGLDDVLAAEDGLPGQAAKTRRTATSHEDARPAAVPSPAGTLASSTLTAVPMLLQDQQVAGVVVVAGRPLPPDAIALLEHASTELAVSVQNALAHEEIARLAGELRGKNDELQARYEEIQAQQEELQAQSEELQSQNEELQAQSEELQAQSEELRAQGEELQAQAEALRRTVEKLSASEEALRQSDKNKSDFMALLSHELRNPLAPIRNSLYVLGHSEPGSEQAARAQRIIDRQVEQLARLVEDLLDVTRISRGKVQLRRTAVDLGRLVRQAAEDNRGHFTENGIELDVRVPEEPVAVDGDPARLSQVIGNLMQNAAKFTPTGGRVSVHLENAGGTARLRVHDTGVGMDAETLGRLFQPFVQAEGGLARSSGGLGLGLALVKGFVEMHGGSVRAASEGCGQGSEFVVELPTTAEAPPEEAPHAAGARAARRVLVIEDNVDAAESLREALRLSRHEVEVAYTGASGIEKARDWRPSIVLCDVGLPDISGYQVARAFREDPILRSVLLIALTGYALPDDLKRASEAGFDDHLGKPPSMDRLEDLLSQLRPDRPAAGAES